MAGESYILATKANWCGSELIVNPQAKQCSVCGALSKRASSSRCLKCGSTHFTSENPTDVNKEQVADKQEVVSKLLPPVVVVPPKATDVIDTTPQSSVEGEYRVLTEAARNFTDSLSQARWNKTLERQRELDSENQRVQREKAILGNQFADLRKELYEQAVSSFVALDQQLNDIESAVGTGTFTRDDIDFESIGIRPRTELVRVGGIAVGTSADNSRRSPCIVPLLNASNLVIRVQRTEQAANLIQGILTRLLVENTPGQLLLNVIDPDVTSICSPFVRLRDINTALAPKIASTDQEIDSLLRSLKESMTQNSQVLQGGWNSLGEFIDDRRGEEKIPFQVLVVLGREKQHNKSRDELLQVILRQGPKLGISTIVVDSAHVDAKQNLDLNESNSEVIDLRGNARWMRFPLLEFSLDRSPSNSEIRQACEVVARSALIESAPLIDLDKLVAVDREIWQKSSADRIDVLVGRGGAETVAFTLGDSKENLHNVLIGGTVGTGKSNLLLTMIYSIAANYSPDEVEMYLLDFKEGVEFARFARKDSYLPHAKIVGIQADARLGQGVLKGILKELEKRSKLLLEHNVTNLANYRAETGKSMPRILVVIDEFQELFNDEDVASENADLLESVVRRGRSFGIHVVLASQTISGIKGMARNQDAIFDQFRVRIALRLNRDESQVILDRQNFGASELRNRGEAILNTETGRFDGNRHVVVAYASDQTVAQLTQRFHDRGKLEPPRVLQRGVLANSEHYKRLLDAQDSSKSGIIGSSLLFAEGPVEFSDIGSAGRHIVMVGDGDHEAVGIIHAFTDSLSFRMKDDLQIIVLNKAHHAAEDHLNRNLWFKNLRSNGSEIDEIECISEVDSLIERRRGTTTVIVAFGMHDLPVDTKNERITSPEILKEIATNGHKNGITFFGWWQNIAPLTRQFGYEWNRQMLGRIVLKTEASTIREVLGSGYFGLRTISARALFLDASGDASAEFLIPYSAMSEE